MTMSSIQTDLDPTSITNNTNRPFKMPRSAFSTHASIQNETRLAQGIPTQRHCFVLSRKTWLGPWNIQGRAQVRSQQCGTSQKYQGNWVEEGKWWTSWRSWTWWTRWRPQCHDADVHEVNEPSRNQRSHGRPNFYANLANYDDKPSINVQIYGRSSCPEDS